MEYVILNNQHGRDKPFIFDHALRILRMANQGGWVISDKSKYEYVDGELIRRRNKEEDRKRAEPTGTPKVEAKEVSTKRSLRDNNPAKRVQSRPSGNPEVDKE